MRQMLLSEGLDVSCVKELCELPTGCAVIVLHGSQNRIIVYSGANGGIKKSDVEFLKESVANYDMVVLQHEIPMEINEAVAEYAKANGVPVFLNTAPFAPVSNKLMSCLAYICANETEAECLSGVKICDVDSAKCAAEKIIDLGAKNALITLGSMGAYLLGEAGECYSPAITGVKVVDTTAAGDSFIGGFVYAVTSGMNVEAALEFANRIASVTVSRKGAIPSLPKRSEV